MCLQVAAVHTTQVVCLQAAMVHARQVVCACRLPLWMLDRLCVFTGRHCAYYTGCVFAGCRCGY